jgi:hypothetical protein
VFQNNLSVVSLNYKQPNTNYNQNIAIIFITGCISGRKKGREVRPVQGFSGLNYFRSSHLYFMCASIGVQTLAPVVCSFSMIIVFPSESQCWLARTIARFFTSPQLESPLFEIEFTW